MSPWVPIVVSAVTTVILGLLAFVVRRELTAIAETHKAQVGALQALRKEHAEQLSSLWKELRHYQLDSDTKYLSRDLFDRLETARKEAEAERRSSEKQLVETIERLTRRLEEGRGGKSLHR